MKTPPSLDNWLSSALVSLTLLAFASLMLALPLYRLAAANWPEPIVEQVFPDGRVTLRESMPLYGNDGMVRSRPLNAARIEFDDQAHGAFAHAFAVASFGSPMDLFGFAFAQSAVVVKWWLMCGCD